MHDTTAILRILVVEDDYFIADDIVRSLRAAGLAIAGPVSGEAAASAELDQASIDFAVVDINLNGSISFGVAAELRKRGIPFLFLTGYESSVVPAEFQDAVLMQKPHDGDMIVAEIRRQQNLG